MTLYYPKIPDSKDFLPSHCVAFEKYDGTNVFFDWKNEFGVHTFGTRRDAFLASKNGNKKFCAAHPGLEQVYEAIDKDALDEVLKNSKYKDSYVMVFGEFLGRHSFAGKHIEQDDKRIVLFDVMVDCVLLSPDEFLSLFVGFPNVSQVVYRGKFTGSFVEDVRKGKYNVREGVVCKGVHNGEVHMCKIKTNEYMEKLKNNFGESWKEYWE